jgi:hypothetical protein
MTPQPAPKRSQISMVLLGIAGAFVVVVLSVFGTLAISGALAGPRVQALDGSQISATSTAISAHVQATATANAIAVAPSDPLAGMHVLSWMYCASTGTGCTKFTSFKFTTTGAFDLVWVCSTDFVSPTPNAQLALEIFAANGKQADAISEDCTGDKDLRGVVPEPLPAGVYSITAQVTDGPSWFIVVLEGPPTQGV